MGVDSLVLPRSGVSATLSAIQGGEFADIWTCRVPNVASWETHTRESAIRRADDAVLALRAALLPADARERVARALWDVDRQANHGMVEYDAGNGDAWKYQCRADAVLAALVTP